MYCSSCSSVQNRWCVSRRKNPRLRWQTRHLPGFAVFSILTLILSYLSTGIGRDLAYHSVRLFSVYFLRVLFDETDFSQSCFRFSVFERSDCNLLMAAYQGHAVGWVLELEYGT